MQNWFRSRKNDVVGKAAPLASSPTEPWREMLEVNVLVRPTAQRS